MNPEKCSRNDIELSNEWPVLELMGVDRRQHVRLQPEVLSAIFYMGETKQIVSIRDISCSGVKLVNVPDELNEGDLFTLSACLDGRDTVLALCRVAHVGGTALQRSAGAHFVSIEEEDTQALIGYLEKLWHEANGCPHKTVAL